ncbi:MAG: DUF4169 family protein [Paracoccaceae bacterium]
MAEIVNLRSARKSRKRDAKRSTGAANAARFGRDKAEKALDKARARMAEAHLDAHRREGDEE